MVSPCVVARLLLVALVLAPPQATRGAPPDPVISSGTSTTSVTSSTIATRFPACSVPGDACGNCGPVGQCLEHVDSRPPPLVCVDGGFCVQLGCSADVQCGPGQLCATLGARAACCPPCR